MKRLTFISVVLCILVSCQAASNTAVKMKENEFFFGPQQTAVAEAAARGQTDKLTLLLEQGVDINVLGKDGMTPLLWALIKGSKKGFRFLLAHGANPNFQIKQGNSVMSYASIHEDAEFLELALKYNGDPNLVNPITAKTPIFDSIENLRMNNIRLLIDGSANLNFRDRTGSTPLMVAASLNRYDLVYAMLKGGADPTIKDNWGNTLDYFINRGNMDQKHELYQWRSKVIELLRKKEK